MQNIFDSDDGDKIYQAIDKRTGPQPWADLKGLLLAVAQGERQLYFAMENAVLNYSRQQTEAAFVVGVEMGPALQALAIINREQESYAN